VRPLHPVPTSNPDGVRPLHPVPSSNPDGVRPLHPVKSNPDGVRPLDPYSSIPIIGDHIEKRSITGAAAAATIDGLKLLAIGNVNLLRQLDELRHDVLVSGADVASILAHAEDIVHRIVYKRDTDLNLLYNSLELLAGNALNLLVAAGRNDVAQALYNQLVDLVNKADDGSISLQDAFNAAVQDISNAINNAAGKRELAARGNDVVQNTLNLVQLLANNAVALLNAAGRSDVSKVLTSQINKLEDEARRGTLSLSDVVNSANRIIASYL